jgi:phosphate:Na+ symporter
VGTTLKFLLFRAGITIEKKQVAYGNFFMNLITVFLAVIFLKPIVYLIQEVIAIGDPLIGLVAFQSGINLLAILIMYPLLHMIAGWLQRFIRSKQPDRLAMFIHTRTTALPNDALDLAEQEITHLLHETIRFNRQILGLKEEKNETWLRHFRDLATGDHALFIQYENIKQLQGEIMEYIAEIPKQNMSEAEIERTGQLININRHILRSAKNLKDVHHNFDEFESSPNDVLYLLYQQMKALGDQYYDEYEQSLDQPATITQEVVNDLIAHNRKQYDDNIAILMDHLRHDRITELEFSNLVNANREIYSSNKALTRSLADLRYLEADD